MNIWFTSDTHYNHSNIIGFTNRPFSSCKEMDEALIENYNSLVKEKDIVYHLGDFCWSYIRRYTDALNGRIHLIYGGHDREALRHQYLFEEVTPLKSIKIGNTDITLCHYAMRVWNKSHWGAYALYGHSHGKLPSYGKSFDVGVDCHKYFPINFDQVVTIMNTLEENKDVIKNK